MYLSSNCDHRMHLQSEIVSCGKMNIHLKLFNTSNRLMLSKRKQQMAYHNHIPRVHIASLLVYVS